MRSRKVIIGNERQEDFDELAAGWRAEYEPEGRAAESLIERVILNDWFLRRAEGQYMDAEAELAAAPPLERTAEQHHKMELYLRYKTTAERSFYRAFNALRGLRKDKLKEALDLDRVRAFIDKYAVEAVEKADQRAQQETQAKAKQVRKSRTPAVSAARVVQFPERQDHGQGSGCDCNACRRGREALEKRRARGG